ncbi:AER206Cp [Eremothecium gossypii ATCC 10895]|uniref:Pre-mRNA-splicing factor 38 n=1 Tax=Eremothecium gossypii (strain ATCC 10895 / CBS 109.51 / FGSC 9923 / NRRL Y-1056) TaxID=284811 RepID=Q756P8_EREGS|nr:AER206Cp [Eremothecium gossypii ATCC 10895]AAS52887.1 AER206Cp [Eremothecium gossypii ATCC 10895]AEY97195.1 FAER206Cp [Eremothecium gossypii FDAG1]
MPQEFLVESHISDKQLSNQSTSLVIPKIARLRIHNSMYYKINLYPTGLRGNTLKQLVRVLVRDLGACKHRSGPMLHICGNTEFQCLLMKVIEIRPTWSQIYTLLQLGDERKTGKFNNKYIAVLILVYLRIQYYFLADEKAESFPPEADGDVTAAKVKALFAHFLADYRKVKCLDLEVDCWSGATQKSVSVQHVDEIVDWLCTKDSIWGIPLGRCRWLADVLEADAEAAEGED